MLMMIIVTSLFPMGKGMVMKMAWKRTTKRVWMLLESTHE
jgi:hypothetical protein